MLLGAALGVAESLRLWLWSRRQDSHRWRSRAAPRRCHLAGGLAFASAATALADTTAATSLAALATLPLCALWRTRKKKKQRSRSRSWYSCIESVVAGIASKKL
eukprot:4462893-Prymnesium_polylepis.1